MPTPLEKYIQTARKKGWSDTKIQSSLLESGWNQMDIAQYIETDDLMPPPPPPSIRAIPGKTVSIHSTSMWDAFLHILMFISLYASTVSILSIFHILIDQWFPKYTYSTYGSSNTIILMPLAVLLVAFPFFAFLFLKTTSDSLKNPALKQFTTRKILIYITLIATFVTMLISMIALVFSFLSGDLSTRFLLKFTVTVAVTGLIFVHYLKEVKS